MNGLHIVSGGGGSILNVSWRSSIGAAASVSITWCLSCDQHGGMRGSEMVTMMLLMMIAIMMKLIVTIIVMNKVIVMMKVMMKVMVMMIVMMTVMVTMISDYE
jgi:hypothetical protein